MTSRKKNRSTTARPLKMNLYDAIVELPPEVSRAIEQIRTQAQADWQAGVERHLMQQGITRDIARYAALHSLEVSTATEKAKRIAEIIDEMSRY